MVVLRRLIEVIALYSIRPWPCQGYCNGSKPHRSSSVLNLLLILLSRLQAPAERFTGRATISGVPLEAAAAGVPAASATDASADGPSKRAAEPGAAAVLGLTALNYAPPFELGLTDAVRPLHMLTVSVLRSRQHWEGHRCFINSNTQLRGRVLSSENLQALKHHRLRRENGLGHYGVPAPEGSSMAEPYCASLAVLCLQQNSGGAVTQRRFHHGYIC